MVKFHGFTMIYPLNMVNFHDLPIKHGDFPWCFPMFTRPGQMSGCPAAPRHQALLRLRLAAVEEELHRVLHPAICLAMQTMELSLDDENDDEH
jgi:hypothetical protein